MPRKSRHTQQKELLEQESKKFTGFFNVEELHKAALRKNKDVGIATVYRFLKRKVSSSSIHSYSCQKRLIYSNQKLSHGHFTCEKCKRNQHFELSSIDFIEKKIPGKICHIQIDVHGTCSECLKKEK